MQQNTPMYIAVQLESDCGKDFRKAWLPLPATKKQFAAVKESVSGPCCADVTINHYGVKVPCMNRYMLAETPLAQVNHLAARLAALDDEQILKLCAIHESEMYFTSVEQLIEYTYTTDKYTLAPDIFCEEELGRRAIRELDPGRFPPEIIENLMDPHTYGRGIAEMEHGEFTSFGYLTQDAGWNGTAKKHRIPAGLDLKGDHGEDLYGEFEYDLEE